MNKSGQQYFLLGDLTEFQLSVERLGNTHYVFIEELLKAELLKTIRVHESKEQVLENIVDRDSSWNWKLYVPRLQIVASDDLNNPERKKDLIVITFETILIERMRKLVSKPMRVLCMQ